MPDFLVVLIARAKQVLDLERVVIFGSRARGDHHERSDYDLCFYVSSPRQWAQFVVEAQENSGTLCPLDLVKFDSIDTNLAAEITQNGVLLYDGKKSADRV